MSENVISKSKEIKKVGKKYRRRKVVFAIVDFLLIMLIWFGYAFLAGAYNGYGDKPAMEALTNIEWLKFLANIYPSTKVSVLSFDFSSKDLIWRLVILGGSFVFAILFSWFFAHLRGKRLAKKYEKKYAEALYAECELNGLTLAKAPLETKLEQEEDVLKEIGLENPKSKALYTFASSSLSYQLGQYEYSYNSKTRHGVLIVDDIIDNTTKKVDGLIQIRSYSKPGLQEFNGKEIKKYGFNGESDIRQFTVYSDLGNDIYAVINAPLQRAVIELQRYVASNIVISLVKSRVAIYIDGWNLKLTRSIKDKKLENDILEKEREALYGLHSLVAKVILSLAVSSKSDNTSNGL